MRSDLSGLKTQWVSDAMTVRRSLTALLLLGLVLGACPAKGDDKDLVRLDSQMEALQDETGRMQRSFDQHMSDVEKQIARNADASSKMAAAIASLQASVESQATKSRQSVNEISGLGQSVNEGFEQARERLAKATRRLDQAHPVRLTVPSPSATGAVRDADYDRALRDYKQGKNAAAWREFSECALSHPGTDLAGASYFYMAEIRYGKGDYQQAIAYYNLALKTAPGGSKAAAAELKKGGALVHLGLTDDGMVEFLHVIKEYPNSNEATLAKKVIAKLKALSQ
jgi:TolA-binding protein